VLIKPSAWERRVFNFNPFVVGFHVKALSSVGIITKYAITNYMVQDNL